MSITGVAFSSMNKGDFVMCLDEGKESTMSVWRWREKKLLGRSATNQTLTKGCAFHPLDNNLMITFGKDHLVNKINAQLLASWDNDFLLKGILEQGERWIL